MTEQLHFHFSRSCIGEGNGNPLQCSCLENPRDGGAWWAAVSRIAQSRTRLKWLSSSSSKNTAWIRWKLKSDILKTHWGKHFWCWFSLHSSQFLSLSSDNSEETPCLDHLTGNLSHRTPQFIMPCLVMQLNMLRKTTSLQFYCQKAV